MDQQELFLILSNISKYSVAIPVAIGLYKMSRLVPVQFKIGYVVLLSLVFEFLAIRDGVIQKLMTHFFNEETNLPGLHLFTLLQTLLILWVYRDFMRTRAQKWVLPLLAIGFSLFAIVNAVWIDGIWKLNPHARAIQSLLILSIIFSYFFALLRNTHFVRLEKEPLFWISAGLIIYFSGSFFIFLASNYFLTSPDLLRSIYGIHSVLNIIANLFYAAALWVTPPK